MDTQIASTTHVPAFVPLTPLHGSIVKAICAVKSTVEAVRKSQHNAHGNYKFASADDIYAAVTRKLGEVGLVIIPLQLKPCEIKRVETDATDRQGNPTGAKKTAQWASFEFAFALATEEATWFDPRSVQPLIIQVTGPQTFNAAQSYAEKTYLRALFQIPTGDMDLDAMAQEDTEEDQVIANGRGRASRKSSAEGKRDGTVKTFNEIRSQIARSPHAHYCRQVWLLHAEELRTMSRAWFETLSEEFVFKMRDHGEELEVDEYGWPILGEEQEAA